MIKYNIVVCCNRKILVNVAAYVIPGCVYVAYWSGVWCINTETCRSNFIINFILLVCAYVGKIINVNLQVYLRLYRYGVYCNEVN